jgi:thiamine-phosphate pyrophosphorylase
MHQFTPAAERALTAAAQWRTPEAHDELGAPALLLGLLDEPECRAAIMLSAHGVDDAAVRQNWPNLLRVNGEAGPKTQYSNEVEASLDAAAARLTDFPRPIVLATEHVLLGLLAANHPVSQWLIEQGLDADDIERQIHRLNGFDSTPIEFDIEERESEVGIRKSGESAPCGFSRSGSPVLRLLDASANRAREGLRVIEDYARFILDNRELTEQVKRLRHDLGATLRALPSRALLESRDTAHDVGTQLGTEHESRRDDAASVATASCKRVEEALRSLEEYGKLIDSAAAERFKQMRYRMYTLERAVHGTVLQQPSIAAAQLYVLVDGRESLEEFERVVNALIAGGADIVQLRDKNLNDRELLERGRALRRLTRGTKTLFVMNDRPDLAVLCEADGVHVGQQELSVAAVRAVVGPAMLVGVSTHTIEQARQAVADGASYIGVGPVFYSGTKQFEHLAGLDLVRAVAAEISLPAFAIGGITAENVDQVVAAGPRRIAVSGAVLNAADRTAALHGLRSRLS